MKLQVGDPVHFYRDDDMPGQRGPYPAVVMEPFDVVDETVFVTVRVSGPGGSWTEEDIPIVQDVSKHRARCCTRKAQKP